MTTFTHADKLDAALAPIAEELVAFRRDIHQHPELGFETARTIGLVRAKLEAAGLAPDTEIVKGGLVCLIEGNRPGKTVALRADVDCLPMTDCSTTDWKSRTEGLAHACGHDGHTTWLTAAGLALAADRDFPGRVLLIFQPNEEGGTGARAVIDAGVLTKYDVAEIFGAHTEPLLPKGTYGFRVGPLQASADLWYATLTGKGTHGGRPHLGIDPIPVAAQIVNALQTIVSRKVDPIDTAVVSCCSITAGRYETPNVIPHEAKLSGTVRTFMPQTRKDVEHHMRAMITGIAEANGLTAEITYKALIPAVINAKEPAESAMACARERFGAESVTEMKPMMSSEDFAEYLQLIPGTIMRVGIRDDEHTVSLHHQAFDFNDEVLPATGTLLAAMAKKRLAELA